MQKENVEWQNDKFRLKTREKNTYQTHVSSHRAQIDHREHRKWEVSAHTVAFISCRGRVTIILAGVTRAERGSGGGEAE